MTKRTDEEKRELINQIKVLKKEKDLSTEKAAKEVGVTISNYYAWLQKFNIKTTGKKRKASGKVEVITYKAKNKPRKYTKKKDVTAEPIQTASGYATVVMLPMSELTKFLKTLH